MLLFVNQAVDEVRAILRDHPGALAQFDGDETPERVREVTLRSGLQAMKAVRVEEAGDLEALDEYADAADMILFDAKPPRRALAASPGRPAASSCWIGKTPSPALSRRACSCGRGRERVFGKQ